MTSLLPHKNKTPLQVAAHIKALMDARCVRVITLDWPNYFRAMDRLVLHPVHEERVIAALSALRLVMVVNTRAVVIYYDENFAPFTIPSNY